MCKYYEDSGMIIFFFFLFFVFFFFFCLFFFFFFKQKTAYEIRLSLVGSEIGKKVARPDTKGELLELAAKRLNLSTPAALRVFAEGGDEYDGDEDVVLIESDEIIYV